MSETIWREYASQLLTTREVAQFERADANRLTEFLDRVICPQAFRPDRGFYVSIGPDAFAPQRNHKVAERLTRDPAADWTRQTYFTNPMGFDVINDDLTVEVTSSPSSRTQLGDYAVFTFEFDEPSVPFLQTQLSWLRSAKHPLDCPMGDLFKACSRYVDFAGITVNWSGNKSLHIHVVFSTDYITATEGWRAGHKAHWLRLEHEVELALNPGVKADASMKEHEKFRRLPGGSRFLEKPNLLGMKAGLTVPQLTLWERYRQRSSRGSDVSFFDPALFVEIDFAKARRAARGHLALTSVELDYCAERMRDIFGRKNPWPEFHSWGVAPDGNPRAYFLNGPTDKTPASYMEVSYPTVNIVGRNQMGLTPQTVMLAKNLGDTLHDWLAEYAAIHGRVRTPSELMFAESVTDGPSGARAIRRILLETIRDHQLSFVVAPEGVSKTTTLFANHHRITAWLAGKGLPKTVMYAFSSYLGAAEKCGEFNARQGPSSRFVGVVIESFERSYQEVCARLRVQALTIGDAARSGFDNLFHAIEKKQPDVLIAMANDHANRVLEIGNRHPVYFTVQAVAQRWDISSLTRLMAAPSYWTGEVDAAHTALCRRETGIGLLIHDEVKADDLVASYRQEIVDWVQAMRESDLGFWDGQTTQAARFNAYSAFLAANPDPIIHDRPTPVSFETVQDILAVSPDEWEKVTTQDSGEYGLGGERDIYGSRLGQTWAIYERAWPVGGMRTAEDVGENYRARTVVLTTEAVPLALARHSQHGWVIHDLDAPLMPKDVVETHLRAGLKSSRLGEVCEGWRAANPGDWIISNKVKHLSRSMTHATARGTNVMMGQAIMQTMVFTSPEEFEALEALNAWTGRDDLIRSRHIDEFNQSAGRNLGFRKRDGARHTLLVNERLFARLTGEAQTRVRYTMEVGVDRRQRRAATRRARAQAPIVIPANITSAARLEIMRAAILSGRST